MAMLELLLLHDRANAKCDPILLGTTLLTYYCRFIDYNLPIAIIYTYMSNENNVFFV